MPEGTSSPDIGQSPDRAVVELTVNLNQGFQPFNNPAGASAVTLHSGIFPDLQFQARASGRHPECRHPEFRAELQQPTAGVTVTERRNFGRALGGTQEVTWFAPDFLENALGLSIVASSPEGQFKARLDPTSLIDVKLRFGKFVRQNSDQKMEYLADQLEGSEDLSMLQFSFHLDEEDKGKLPWDRNWVDDPNRYLESYIEAESEGDENVAKEVRRRVFSDRRMMKHFLRNPGLLQGPM